MNYDFKASLAQANQDLSRYHEIQEAQHNIDMIQAQFEQLQTEHRHAVERAKALETKAHDTHVYNVMMAIVQEHETVRDAFEELLAVMKLADPEVEAKMKYKGLGL